MGAALSFTCVFVIFIFLFSLLFPYIWRLKARLPLDARALEAWDMEKQLLVPRRALDLPSLFPFIKKKCFSPSLMLSWILFSKLQKVNWISSSEHAKDDCVFPSPPSLSPLPPSPISYDVCSAFPLIFQFLFCFVFPEEEMGHAIFKNSAFNPKEKLIPLWLLCVSPSPILYLLGSFGQNCCDTWYLPLVMSISLTGENQQLIGCK